MNINDLIEELIKIRDNATTPKHLIVIAGDPAHREGGYFVRRVYMGGWIGDGEMLGAAGESYPAATIELSPMT